MVKMTETTVFGYILHIYALYKPKKWIQFLVEQPYGDFSENMSPWMYFEDSGRGFRVGRLSKN